MKRCFLHEKGWPTMRWNGGPDIVLMGRVQSVCRLSVEADRSSAQTLDGRLSTATSPDKMSQDAF